jgi:FMN reductase
VDNSTLRLVGIVGNPKPRSRTYQVVQAVVDQLAQQLGARAEALLDLIDLQSELFGFGSPGVQAALEQVRAADVLVVGSPVYKASYTGLLKAFCDHIAAGELGGKLAVLVMVGGAPQHHLVVEVHLRPLLVELGATCATPGVYVLESDLDRVDATATSYVESLIRQWPRLPFPSTGSPQPG